MSNMAGVLSEAGVLGPFALIIIYIIICRTLKINEV